MFAPISRSMNNNAVCVSLASLLKQGLEESSKKNSSVRFRPVVRAVDKKYAIAYALSIAEKRCLTISADFVSFISYFPQVWEELVQALRDEDEAVLDYNTVHSISLDCAKHAAELCVAAGLPLNCATLNPSWNSLGLSLDIISVINHRRRQEDRWFASADLLSYLPRNKFDSFPHLKDYPSVAAIGVFDGHNGPEAAEHCSHLAPYYLSIGLKKRLCGSLALSITDLLSEVIFLLNEAVNEGRDKRYWASGTTGTICVFYGDRIYTAWVGDSQAWLVYADATDIPKIEPLTNHSSPSPVVVTSLKTGAKQIEDTSDDLKEDEIAGPNLLTVEPTINRERRVSAVLTGRPPTDNLAVALTDRIHRPEFAPEFVSVLRCGGSVTTELMSSCGTTSSTETFVNMQHRLPYWVKPPQSKLTRPKLDDPNLVDCRVAGMSCVSRAIGDDKVVIGMTALPSMTVWERPPKTATCQPLCLIVATDGLWDTDDCCGQDVAVIARKWFREHSVNGMAELGLSQSLVDLAVEKGALDNVTCCTVWLTRWNPVTNPVKYGLDVPPTTSVRWPRGLRTASQMDCISPDTQRILKNPRYVDSHAMTSTKPSSPKTQPGARPGSVQPVDRIRYSSPPRTKSIVP